MHRSMRGALAALTLLACACTESPEAARPDAEAAPPDAARTADGPPDAGGDLAPPADGPPDATPGTPDTNADAGIDAASDGSPPADGPPADGPTADLPPLTGNARCAGATPLAFVKARALVRGSTAGSRDEFRTITCGTRRPYPGPQRYYSFRGEAGKRYEISLDVHDAPEMYLYVFGADARCKPAAIDAHCASLGARGDRSGAIRRGRVGTLRFNPARTATYLVAVDSRDPSHAGAFTLEIRERALPKNAVCGSAADIIVPASGSVTVRGDNTLLAPARSPITCNGRALLGAPLFYRFTARAGAAYAFTVTPGASWCPYLAFFSASARCKPAAIDSECSSFGRLGAIAGCSYSKRTYVFRPAAAGRYYIAVAGASRSFSRGTFTMAVAETKATAGSSCHKPAALALTAGKPATVSGDTSRATPELTGLTCGPRLPLRGPQIYYRFAAAAGQSFRFTIDPTFYAYLVVYKEPASCSLSAVEASCRAGGAVFGGTSRKQSYVFRASSAGAYIIMVKSASASLGGAFKLTAESLALPKNGRCTGATFLDLATGPKRASGDTALSTPEFSPLGCGRTILQGPQQYVRFKATAGNLYRVTVTPTAPFCPHIVIAPAACSAGAISRGCGSGGGRGAVFGCSRGPATYTFKPAVTGDFVLAVKGRLVTDRGRYTLEVAEVVAPKNGTCTAPQRVGLDTRGRATITGDTSRVARSDLDITCGGARLSAPQLYYELPHVSPGSGYRLTFTPRGWRGRIAIFPKAHGCNPALVGRACNSGDLEGATFSPASAAGASYTFAPATAGSYIVAVDGGRKGSSGPFTLAVERVAVAKPKNAACAAATPLVFSGGRATAAGDTRLSHDEYPSLRCSSVPSVAIAMKGRQVYYSLPLKKGRLYRFEVDPRFRAAMYVFGGTCTAAGIAAGCQSGGALGAYVIAPPGGGRAQLLFAPPRDGSYRVAVDAVSRSEAGTFTLTVDEHTPPVLRAPFALDFEKGCGGLVASGDWECGTSYAFKASPLCGSPAPKPPPAPHSGKGMWGTVLNGCHRGLANAGRTLTVCKDLEPSDDSVLAFDVRIPTTWTTATLVFWSWDDYHAFEEWAEVRIDGKPAATARYCKPGEIPRTRGWTRRAVPLPVGARGAVRVAFHFKATAGRNLAGWYIDDVAVSGR